MAGVVPVVSGVPGVPVVPVVPVVSASRVVVFAFLGKGGLTVRVVPFSFSAFGF